MRMQRGFTLMELMIVVALILIIAAMGAAPEVFDRTGKRRFCSTEKDVIRVDSNSGGSTNPPDAEQCAGFSALK